MISSLHGTVLHATAGQVVIDVGGVGFSVAVPADVAHVAVVGERMLLHTSLIVREDALSLFGFAERDELEIFTLLISVTGVGPKSALGVLSHLTVDQIAEAVTAEDDAPFRRVSGIGPKTAKLIVVSLAGKLPELGFADAGAPAGGAGDPAQLVAEAVGEGLVGLGWSDSDARQAVQDARDAGAPEDHAGLLRAALALLQAARSGAGARR